MIDSVQLNDNEPVSIALIFINSYVDNCNRLKESIGVLEWVRTNDLTTNKFKLELNSIVEEALKMDPEMGLESDPIFDAQDYPDQGFNLNRLMKKRITFC